MNTQTLWLVVAICTTLVGCQSDLSGVYRQMLTGTVLVQQFPHPDEAASPASEDQESVSFTLVVPSRAEAPLDLATALQRAGADNPTIALAREAVQASRAEHLQASVLLLPSLNAGASFNVHRGNLQSAPGVILDVDRQSMYAGAGAFAVGAGTVGFPGVRLTTHLADALYEPHATQQEVTARHWEADATRNRVLLAVSLTYFEWTGAAARRTALIQSESELAELVTLTAQHARAGQAREADAQRAQTEASLLRSLRLRIEEEAAVAVAELARLLDLDPSVCLQPPEGPLPLVHLVNPKEPLEALVQLALAGNPELQARRAEVEVTETRLRKEKARPWLPFLAVGFSAGEFGGGSNLAETRFGHFKGRTDFDVMAVWSLRNAGVGNHAVQGRLDANVGEALAERTRIANALRCEVAEAYALCADRLQQVEVARRRVTNAQQAYRLDLTRTKNLEGRLIETLNSINLLVAARQDLIRVQVGYNQAQFRLFVALGQPPLNVAPHVCAERP